MYDSPKAAIPALLYVLSAKRMWSDSYLQEWHLYRKERGMNMVKMNIKDLDRNITAEEMKELEAAEKMMPMYDEDSPEMTEDMLQQFKRMHQVSRVKKTASIRLSEKAQLFSKKYGKG